MRHTIPVYSSSNRSEAQKVAKIHLNQDAWPVGNREFQDPDGISFLLALEPGNYHFKGVDIASHNRFYSSDLTEFPEISVNGGRITYIGRIEFHYDMEGIHPVRAVHEITDRLEEDLQYLVKRLPDVTRDEVQTSLIDPKEFTADVEHTGTKIIIIY